MKSNCYSNNYKKRDGFTLIEIIVAIAVSVILMAVAIPAVSGFLLSSEMIELNQNAKTIYLAAQDYLTQAAAGGGLEAINSQSQKVSDPSGILPKISAQEMADNKDNLAYLVLSKAGTDDRALVDMLKVYLSDPNIMEQSVLVEYNRNTGVVRSVFYSKKAASLSYAGGITDGGNVLDRNEPALRQKRQGYYGVDYTGNLQNAAALSGTKPLLINSERLTLEWDDTTPKGDEWQKILTYTITIYSEDLGTEYLRIEGIQNPAAKAGGYPTSIKAAMNSLTTADTYWSGVVQANATDRQHAISVRAGDKPGDPQKMVLVLDDVHKAIYEKYPSIAIGNLHATVEPAADWVKVPPSQTKKAEHSYFANGKLDVNKKSSTFELIYPRHLNNIRHAAPDSNYVLPKTSTGAECVIDWSKPENTIDACGGTPLNFETVNFQYRKYKADGTSEEVEDINGYRGSLRGEGSATIAKLTIAPAEEKHLKQHKDSYDFTKYYGLFSKLGKDAVVENLKLPNFVLDSSIINKDKVFSYMGAIAGYAVDATIKNCTIGSLSTSDMVRSYSIAAVTQADKDAYVGGVLGYAQNCTIDTVTSCVFVNSGSYDKAQRQVLGGRDNVGGFAGYMQGGSIKNSKFTDSVYGGNNVGGFVGRNYGASLTGVTSSDAAKKYVVGLMNVGGIVGYNESGVVTNATATWTKMTIASAETTLVGVLTELVNPVTFEANLLKFNTADVLGMLGTENVGGIIGLNDVDGTLSGFTTKQVVKGGNNVGGIVGNNKGAMSWSKTNKTSDGVVICSGAYAGGILGVNSNSGVKLDGLLNKSHVVAREYAGGIIGSNGDAGNSRASTQAATISNCENAGAVFAYKQYGGGIAGRNLGTIQNCSSAWANADALDKRLSSIGVKYGNYVGGITGYNNGKIVACNNGNLVKGQDFVGGITGHNDTNGNIYGCETTGGRVVGVGNFVGGYIGLNTSDQLSDGDKAMGDLNNRATLVKGERFVGGIIGCNLFTKGNLTIQATNGDPSLREGDAKQTVVEGKAYVGGIIGYNCMKLDLNNLPDPTAEDRPGVDGGSGSPSNQTKLTLCSNYGEVKTERYGGGIIGLNSSDSVLHISSSTNNGTISHTNYASGTVDDQKSYYIAGITGRNTRTGVIESCNNNGKIRSRSKYTGGLVEVNEGLMIKCTNGGQVLAEKSNYVGGIAGYNITAGNVAGGKDGKATIRECLINNTARVSGVSYIGGIVGANAAVLEGCALKGDADYNNETYQVSGTGDCVGGITGFNQSTGLIYGCTTQGGSVRGRNFVGGIIGYSTSSQTLSGDKTAYTTNGARVYGQYFVGGITSVLPDKTATLQYCANSELARVIGYGTQTTGTQILTIEERDASNNDVVRNISYDLMDMGVGGILGMLPATGVLENCFNNGIVVGAGAQTGGITGLNHGMVQECTNRGVVIGSSQASALEKRDALAAIQTDKDYVGGIVGRNTGSVLLCVSEENKSGNGNKTNRVAGRWDVGGIVGYHESGTVTNPAMQSTSCQVEGFSRVGGIFGRWNQESAVLNIEDAYKKVSASVLGTSVGKGLVPSKVNEAIVGGIFGQVDTNERVQTVVASGYSFDGLARLETVHNYQYLGGIVGKTKDIQTIEDCVLTGTIVSGVTQTGNTGIGGIVGFNDGIVQRCTLKSTGSVRGDSKLGGIIGDNATKGRMLFCLNEAGSIVNGTGSVIGGYMGGNQNPTGLERSNATDTGGRLINLASVTGGEQVGGIVGRQMGNASACDNSGPIVVNKYYAGGVVGFAVASNADYTVSDCANKATITMINIGTENAGGTGGIVGVLEARRTANKTLTVINCTNEGNIDVPDKHPVTGVATYARYVGGVVGQVQSGGIVKNCTNAKKATIWFNPGDGIHTPNNTVVSVGGAGVGGIAGLVTGGSVIGCESEGTLVLDMKQPNTKIGNNPEGVAIGGIVGSATNGASVEDCTHKGTLRIAKEYKYQGIGGVVGSASKAPAGQRSANIVRCSNESAITSNWAYSVGGILGLSSGAKIDNCENTAPISAMYQVGGVVGALFRDRFDTLQDNTITGSTNSGEISNNPGKIAGSSDAIGGILGDVGAWEASVLIEDCTNTGKIQPRSVGKTVFTGAGGILGKTSFGPQDTIRIIIKNSENSAQISPLDEGRKAGIGGIIGNALYPVRVEGCTNTGLITDDGKGTYESVGGIVGNMEHKLSLVIDSKNHGAVLATAGTDYGYGVGGIVGINQGTVASCLNVALPGNSTPVSIEGRDGVGGIVGLNNRETALVFSTPDSSTVRLTTTNEMPIKATIGSAGGIAGKNFGGAVVDTFNLGDIEGATAGGIIGIATAYSTEKPLVLISVGQLANSYNVGAVTGGHLATGGIVGKRTQAYDSVTSHNIKQAFYLYESAQNTVVGPEYSVGNEPDAAGTIGKNDEPLSGVAGADRRLTAALFVDNGIAVPDFTDLAALRAAVLELQAKQEYYLNQPRKETVNTESLQGYEYTTSWEMVQGLVDHYEVYLRKKGDTSDTVNANIDILIGKSSAQPDAQGRLETFLSFNIQAIYNSNKATFERIYGQSSIEKFDDMIGYEFDIVVKTISQKTPSQSGPNDSLARTSEEARRILPVLPTPDTKQQLVIDKIYDLTINAPDQAAFTAILDRTKYKNLPTDELYTKSYWNGLNTANAIQYQNEGALNPNWRATNINPDPSVAPLPTNQAYTFQIDHAKDFASDSTNPNRTIHTQSMSGNTKTGYAHSLIATLKYKVQVRLQPPVNIGAKFVGDNANATYEMYWYKVNNNSGYLVEVSYKATDNTVKTETIVVQKDGVNCKWKVPADAASGVQATFTVTTLGENYPNTTPPDEKWVYLTSEKSAQYPINLPLKLTSPTLSCEQDANNDTSLTVNWIPHNDLTLISEYALSIKRYKVGEDPTKAVDFNFTVDSKNTVNISKDKTSYPITVTEADFGWEYLISIKAQGVKETSISSELTTVTFPLYVRRPTTSAVQNISADARPDKRVFTFQWDKMHADNTAYEAAALPGKFALRFTRQDNTVVHVQSIDIADILTAGYEYRFDEANGFQMGETYNVQLMALAVSGTYSNSIYSAALAVTLPMSVPVVENFKVTASNPANPVPVTTYAADSYTLSWDSYKEQSLIKSQGSFLPKAYVIENGTKQEIADLTWTPALADILPTTVSITMAKLSPQYAGKEITVELVAVSGSATMDSSPAVATFTAPKAKLEAPTVATVTQNTPTSKDITLALDPAQVAVLQSLVDWEKNILHYTASMTLVYDVQESDADGIVTSVEKTIVVPMDITDFVDKTTTPAIPAAIQSFTFTQADLLAAIQVLHPTATGVPVIKQTSSATIFLKALNTTVSGFTSSDGTDSDEDAPAGAQVLAALPAEGAPPLQAQSQPLEAEQAPVQTPAPAQPEPTPAPPAANPEGDTALPPKENAGTPPEGGEGGAQAGASNSQVATENSLPSNGTTAPSVADGAASAPGTAGAPSTAGAA